MHPTADTPLVIDSKDVGRRVMPCVRWTQLRPGLLNNWAARAHAHGERHREAEKLNSMSDDPMAGTDEPNPQLFYHGTKADLKPGDLIAPGYSSNYGTRKKAAFVYLSATLEAATWGAELAVGEGRGRIYIVEPLGTIEDDPNLTDKRFPGNPTKSYRSRDAFRVVSEVTDWEGHSPEQLKAMHDHLERLKQLGIEAIEE